MNHQNNLATIKTNLPCSLPIKSSPVGFKTVEGPETKNVKTVSCVDVRAVGLESQKPFNKDQKPCEILVPEEKTVLELYPPVIDVPIRLKQAEVKIHSMIPGKAQHYIQKYHSRKRGTIRSVSSYSKGV